ncbi:MAG: DUF2764 family protein [Bacteroidales bacterium]|nr:DUF2764 family protein [Bacteroidales bacterium]
MASTNYYYLVSGLPVLHFGMDKLPVSIEQLKEELERSLCEQDMQLVRSIFYRLDNANLLRLLQNSDNKAIPGGNLTSVNLLEFIKDLKENDNSPLTGMPEHFKAFVPAYFSEKDSLGTASFEDMLAGMYFASMLQTENEFVKRWYEFELDLTNVQIAIQCRKFNFDKEKNFIWGQNEIGKWTLAHFQRQRLWCTCFVRCLWRGRKSTGRKQLDRARA